MKHRLLQLPLIFLFLSWLGLLFAEPALFPCRGCQHLWLKLSAVASKHLRKLQAESLISCLVYQGCLGSIAVLSLSQKPQNYDCQLNMNFVLVVLAPNPLCLVKNHVAPLRNQFFLPPNLKGRACVFLWESPFFNVGFFPNVAICSNILKILMSASFLLLTLYVPR